MNTKHRQHYNSVANAIAYIQSHFKEQPSLDEVAAAVNLSPHHFQRVFTEWAGVSPKKFMQYTTLEYAKSMLKEQQLNMLEASYEAGLSSTSRLHDLFVSIEGMTPGDYKNGGAALRIDYNFADSPFGQLLIASTDKGICHLSFAEDATHALNALKKNFPKATYSHHDVETHHDALAIFKKDWSQLNAIKLHLKGTPFQIKVWHCLLKIPEGNLTTYGKMAHTIDQPKASRALGSAVGKNPVAYLIPCHRVIQATGGIGGYMWGPVRKSAMIAWEASRVNE